MSIDKTVKSQKPLRILTDATPDQIQRLQAQGHMVECHAERPLAGEADLIIAANAWHLPADAPDPAAFIDAAVRWMQKRVYAEKPVTRRKK